MVEVLTPPAEEPVTLAEAKDHLRVEVALEDAAIGRLITVAREWVERYTRRALVTQTWRIWADKFPAANSDQDGKRRTLSYGRYCPGLAESLWLPGGRVQSVTAVRYIDAAGTLQTLASSEYALDSRDPQRLARIRPEYGKAWPGVRWQPAAVQVEYVVGYGAAAAVPAIAKQAILLHVGWHYEQREATDRERYLGSLELMLADLRLYHFE